MEIVLSVLFSHVLFTISLTLFLFEKHPLKTYSMFATNCAVKNERADGSPVCSSVAEHRSFKLKV